MNDRKSSYFPPLSFSVSKLIKTFGYRFIEEEEITEDVEYEIIED